MDSNGLVVSPSLHLVDLLHHVDDGLWVGASALGVPGLYMELGHLVRFTRLWERQVIGV